MAVYVNHRSVRETTDNEILGALQHVKDLDELIEGQESKAPAKLAMDDTITKMGLLSLLQQYGKHSFIHHDLEGCRLKL